MHFLKSCSLKAEAVQPVGGGLLFGLVVGFGGLFFGYFLMLLKKCLNLSTLSKEWISSDILYGNIQ